MKVRSVAFTSPFSLAQDLSAVKVQWSSDVLCRGNRRLPFRGSAEENKDPRKYREYRLTSNLLQNHRCVLYQNTSETQNWTGS
jgi:hypothetical protein